MDGFWVLQHGMVLLGIQMRTKEAHKPWCCIFGGVFPQDVGVEGDIVFVRFFPEGTEETEDLSSPRKRSRFT